MAYCPNCGSQVVAGARFCSYCGSQVASSYEAYSHATQQPSTPVYTGTGYGVMLVSLDRCRHQTAADLLSDVCGYTDAEAMNLLAYIPTFVAQSLSKDQAVYLAQTLTEYGMQAAIYDRNGNCTLNSDVGSVFDAAGSLIAKVAGLFGLIGIGNRITRAIRRFTLPQPPRVYTHPRPVPPPPPRRQVIHHPAPGIPRPALRPAGFHGPFNNGARREPTLPSHMPTNRPNGGHGGHGGHGPMGGPGGHGGFGGPKGRK